MQWFIDIIKDWVIAQGYLAQAYFCRGDPVANEFLLGDFVADGTWRDLDLSPIVPANAKGVALHFQVRNTIISKQFRVRPKGNANSINIAGIRTQVANLLLRHDCTIACDSNRFIQYNLQAGGWNFLSLDVKGWWF